jgi:L-seryl-tRNA(Ser) seleniumtransferase
VAFSGGKAIRGPQSTGILCGNRDLIAAAAVQMLDMDDHWELWDPPVDFIDKSQFGGIPRHGIGRSMKVSKEEIIGLLAALDRFVSGAYDADVPVFRTYLETIAGQLRDCAARCTILEKGDGESVPILEIAIDESRLGRSAFEVCRSLRAGSPPVYVGHGRLAQGVLVINPLCLTAPRADALARCLHEELKLSR